MTSGVIAKYLVVVAGLGGVVYADDAELKSDQLVLPKGGIDVNAQVEINLSQDRAGKPISISPDLWYGATDDLTIGLVHSTTGATGLLGGVADSLCLGDTDRGCDHLYRDVGVDARVRVAAPLSFDGGLYIRDFDPFQLAIKLGLGGRWHLGKAAIEVQPNVFIGLTKRDGVAATATTPAIQGNSDVLTLPVTASYEVVEHLELAAQLGFVIPFEHAGDFYRIPLSIAGRYQVNEHLGLGLAFTLLGVVGGDATQHGVDGRVLTIGGTYAL